MRNFLLTALLLVVLVPAAAPAAPDPYIATYKAKDNSNYFSVIKKLVISKGKRRDYHARMEIVRYLHGEGDGKIIVLEAMWTAIPQTMTKQIRIDYLFISRRRNTPRLWKSIQDKNLHLTT